MLCFGKTLSAILLLGRNVLIRLFIDATSDEEGSSSSDNFDDQGDGSSQGSPTQRSATEDLMAGPRVMALVPTVLEVPNEKGTIYWESD